MGTSPANLMSERIRQQWDDLTEDEIDWIGHDSGRLIDALCTKFGISRDEAARQVAAFLSSSDR